MKEGRQLSGQTIVITGASSGIGRAAARKFHSLGANVVLVGRSPLRTKEIAQELGSDFFIVDFENLSEVRSLAKKLLKKYPKIDVLVNNAGMVAKTKELTKDGHESTFQVNYLASFLLTNLLIDRLIKSHAKVINTSSRGNLFGRVDINKLGSGGFFNNWLVYGTTKLMNILHARELNTRYGTSLSSASFHPGVVATNFGRNSLFFNFLYKTLLVQVLATPEKGAEVLEWLVLSKAGKDWKSGEYYDKVGKMGAKNFQANDKNLSHLLWEGSLKLIK